MALSKFKDPEDVYFDESTYFDPSNSPSEQMSHSCALVNFLTKVIEDYFLFRYGHIWQ